MRRALRQQRLRHPCHIHRGAERLREMRQHALAGEVDASGIGALVAVKARRRRDAFEGGGDAQQRVFGFEIHDRAD